MLEMHREQERLRLESINEHNSKILNSFNKNFCPKIGATAPSDSAKIYCFTFW